MTLDELLSLIKGSTVDDWHKMDIHTVYGWEFGQRQGQSYLEPNSHNSLAVYKPDVDVSIAFDATVNDNFSEPWTAHFADPHSSSVAVWLRYRGAVVFETVGVVVDGGRYLLPMPELLGGGYVIEQSELPLSNLLFDLYGAKGPYRPLSLALAQAQIQVV